MADVVLFNNLVYDFLITDNSATGAVVVAPPGDVDSAVSGAPASLPATIGTMPSGPSAGSPSLHLDPNVQRSDATNGGGNIACTVTDTAGLTPAVVTFDIVPNPAPVALAIDTATMVATPKAVPTNPGP